MSFMPPGALTGIEIVLDRIVNQEITYCIDMEILSRMNMNIEKFLECFLG